eukprot:scaffold83012_cov48-Phaeocystis_antarctica.AAC.1
MAQGAAAAATLAAEVNARRTAAGVASQIRVLDVGGGLPVGWGGTQGPSWEDYSAALRECAPDLFSPAAFDRVVTEFGAAMHCKFAFLASRVELTKPTDGGDQINPNSNPNPNPNPDPDPNPNPNPNPNQAARSP